MKDYHQHLGKVIEVKCSESMINDIPYINYEVPDKSLIKQIEEECKKNGHRFRWGVKYTFGTRDYDTKRLNVVIDKDSDGLFKIKRLYFG